MVRWAIPHFVLLHSYDQSGLYLHDPGLPAYESRHVKWQDFSRAWEYPDENQEIWYQYTFTNPFCSTA
jgi:hypothetical protein